MRIVCARYNGSHVNPLFRPFYALTHAPTNRLRYLSSGRISHRLSSFSTSSISSSFSLNHVHRINKHHRRHAIMSSQRKYDVVVFGATGFTGQLVCKYLLTHPAKLLGQ